MNPAEIKTGLACRGIGELFCFVMVLVSFGFTIVWYFGRLAKTYITERRRKNVRLKQKRF